MPTAKPNTKLPDGIEIFKPGSVVDDSGVAHNFSEADLVAMAKAYNPKLREAPLTVGHPADNLPAYGWVSGLAINAAGRLTMNTRDVEPQFAEMVLTKRFKKRSASFYPPAHSNNPVPGSWYLRHVANLGARQPAVSGLADIPDFADNAQGLVNFSEVFNPTTPEIDMDKELQDQLDAANKLAADRQKELDAANAATKAANDKLAQFAETAKKQRHDGHVSFAEGEVKAGRLLPKDKGSAVAVLDLLADAQPVSFSEGDTTKTLSPADWLKGLITSAKPVVSFGEHAPGNLPAAGLATKDMTDAEVDKLTREYMAANKVTNYAEAIKAVTASFTTSL